MTPTIDENTKLNTSLKMICFILSIAVAAVLWGSKLESNNRSMDTRLSRVEDKIESVNDLKIEMKGQSTTLIHILTSIKEIKQQIKDNAKQGK